MLKQFTGSQCQIGMVLVVFCSLLGYNGSESKLLDCLPKHNCGMVWIEVQKMLVYNAYVKV